MSSCHFGMAQARAIVASLAENGRPGDSLRKRWHFFSSLRNVSPVRPHSLSPSDGRNVRRSAGKRFGDGVGSFSQAPACVLKVVLAASRPLALPRVLTTIRGGFSRSDEAGAFVSCEDIKQNGRSTIVDGG